MAGRQERIHSESEIQARWFRAINTRQLTDDKVMATRVKRDQTFTGDIHLGANPVGHRGPPEQLAF